MRHIGSPDDFKGIHFDLLIEDKEFCRSWRLSDVPLIDGPYVNSVLISPHKLEWLDIPKKIVSGNRGVATRIKKGTFFQSKPSFEERFINLSLKWDEVDTNLVIDKIGCKISRKKY